MQSGHVEELFVPGNVVLLLEKGDGTARAFHVDGRCVCVCVSLRVCEVPLLHLSFTQSCGHSMSRASSRTDGLVCLCAVTMGFGVSSCLILWLRVIVWTLT